MAKMRLFVSEFTLTIQSNLNNLVDFQFLVLDVLLFFFLSHYRMS